MLTAEQINFETFEQTVLNPLHGHQLSDHESYVASLLLDATAARPVDNEHIRIMMGLHFERTFSSRTVKGIIRKLRGKGRAFPIIASRQRPFGYWWCREADEMEAFINAFKGQALDELATIGRMVRVNFPSLVGQLRIADLRIEEESANDANHAKGDL